MKKFLKLFCLAFVPALFACSDDEGTQTPLPVDEEAVALAAPSDLTALARPDAAEFRWSAVEHAKCYAYEFDGGGKFTPKLHRFLSMA